MSQAVHTLYFLLEIQDMSSQLLPQLSGLPAVTLPTRDGDGLSALWNGKLGETLPSLSCLGHGVSAQQGSN